MGQDTESGCLIPNSLYPFALQQNGKGPKVDTQKTKQNKKSFLEAIKRNPHWLIRPVTKPRTLRVRER